MPLLKPGNPADKGPSYRPISLLSPAAKTLESLILCPLQDSTTLAPHENWFPSILGVTFDQLFNFEAHMKHLKEKINNRNILKALAGTS